MEKSITRNFATSSSLLAPDEIGGFLEAIYRECNRKQRLCRDPLALVIKYEDLADREVAGLVCSMLSFGSVDLIMRACGQALEPLGRHPADSLDAMNDADLLHFWGNFQYRFCFPSDMIGLLKAARSARKAYASLENLFLEGDKGGETIVPATANFVRALMAFAPIRKNLLPDPGSGSACKRLFLFMRWMVRRDDIDPGGWTRISPARLIVPLDLHMVRTCQDRLGFIPVRYSKAATKAGDARQGQKPCYPAPTIRTALNVTKRFREYSPTDPVKYDFALTRPGIDPKPGDDIFKCL
ncbi:MAG: DUF2400 domain-containing protein [Spirochaetaceae bacterium]|nr:DUF2400 domain-containing protein [Spirochaetaceae bacterium]